MKKSYSDFRKSSLLFLALLPLTTSCNYRREKTEMPLSTEATYASVQQYILMPKCLGCHTGPGSPKGADLSSYRALMDGKQVVPGNSQASPLYLSVTVGNMPKGMDRLGAAEIALIDRWIAAGALESGTVTPPPPPTPQYDWILHYVFEPRCVVCHNGKHEKTKLDLRTYESLMSFSGEILLAVEPGDPELSSLYRSLRDGTMPPKGEKISPEAIAAISEWITAGAPKGANEKVEEKQ